MKQQHKSRNAMQRTANNLPLVGPPGVNLVNATPDAVKEQLPVLEQTLTSTKKSPLAKTTHCMYTNTSNVSVKTVNVLLNLKLSVQSMSITTTGASGVTVLEHAGIMPNKHVQNVEAMPTTAMPTTAKPRLELVTRMPTAK